MRTFLAAAVTAALLAPGFATADEPLDPRAAAALGFLASQQRLDGGLGGPAEAAWAALAFARNGLDPETVFRPGGASLEAHVVATTTPGLTTNGLARQVLALVASGADARTAPGFDAVAAIHGSFDGTQLGDPFLVNDDAFALQALHVAGVPASDPAVQASRAFLLAQQQPTGAWSFGTSSLSNPDLAFALTSGDVDTTAQVVVALLATGSSPGDAVVERALVWMKANQNLDGGCTWAPVDLVFDAVTDPSRVGQSNADSTSWAILGLRSAGEDPAGEAWTSPAGQDLVGYLASLQQEDGHFLYQPDAESFSPLSTTAWAAVALSGRTFVG